MKAPLPPLPRPNLPADSFNLERWSDLFRAALLAAPRHRISTHEAAALVNARWGHARLDARIQEAMHRAGALKRRGYFELPYWAMNQRPADSEGDAT